MKMPFGKHKGKELDEIIEEFPDYIVWLAENCTLTGELAKIVHKAYQDIDADMEYITQCDEDERYEREFEGDYDRGFTWWDD